MIPTKIGVDYLVYLAVRLALCFLQALTMSQCRGLAEWIAWLACRVDRRHRDVALENLRQAFPNYSNRELQHLVRRVYRHFALVIAEMAHLPRKLHHSNYRRYVTPRNVGPVIERVFRGQPVVLVGGHFGNWEVATTVFGLWGFRSAVVVRPLDNPFLERELGRFRRRSGQTLIAKKGGFEQIQDVLQQEGRLLCVLGDQDAGRHGVFVDFFGRPASTHKAIALFALQYDAAIAVGGGCRTGEGFHYEVALQELFFPADVSTAADPVRELTQRFTSGLERLVRPAPDQYLWLHRRWKSQPGHRRTRRHAVATLAAIEEWEGETPAELTPPGNAARQAARDQGVSQQTASAVGHGRHP